MELKQIRKKHGYTQTSLADAIGVKRGTVARYESGERIPSLSKVKRMSEVLNEPLETIVQLFAK